MQHGTAEKEYDKHAGHSVRAFKVKFWVSLILSIPVVLYSDIVQTLLRWQPPSFPGAEYVPLILGSVIFFYGGWVFLESAYRELRVRLPGMMTLISLAIVTAYVYSVYTVAFDVGRDLFWELSTLIVVMLLGHWIEMRAVSGAQGALRELSKLLPDTAEVLRNGKTHSVLLADVRVGDRVVVRPGGSVPVDGFVAEGASEVDESVATGESRPVRKTVGSEVIAGTTNGDGSLTVRVSKIGDDTFLSGVMRLVAEAQASKSRLQLLSDRAAYYLTLIAVVVGGVTFATWVALSDASFAIERAVAVLVIACPHALGLAIPLVASISTTMAAQSGFLVRERQALEAARSIDVVLFDKTGTLTRGAYGVDSIIPVRAGDENRVLQIAASVNRRSEHPLAQAMVKEAADWELPLSDVTAFSRIAGKGTKGMIGTEEYTVGSPALVQERKHTLDSALASAVQTLARQGKTVVFVMTGSEVLGAIALADVIRPESREAVAVLKEMGLRTAMVTGDAADVAVWVAGELGIDEYFAEVLPAQKVERVKELQRRGLAVAMVGDGINDAPALTQADVGIAIGAGTNVAIESAGIILVRDDPRDAATIIRLSRLTYRKMMQNLAWATGYNVVAIPLAAGVLAVKGIFLQPAVAAIFMSLSTVIVAVNAILLKRHALA